MQVRQILEAICDRLFITPHTQGLQTRQILKSTIRDRFLVTIPQTQQPQMRQMSKSTIRDRFLMQRLTSKECKFKSEKVSFVIVS